MAENGYRTRGELSDWQKTKSKKKRATERSRGGGGGGGGKRRRGRTELHRGFTEERKEMRISYKALLSGWVAEVAIVLPL